MKFLTKLYSLQNKKIKEYNYITDDKIFEMLQAKFQKNHILQQKFVYYCLKSDVIKAIALAYRSGYIRGRKRRSFLIKSKDVNICK